jgi:hypothetical protein
MKTSTNRPWADLVRVAVNMVEGTLTPSSLPCMWLNSGITGSWVVSAEALFWVYSLRENTCDNHMYFISKLQLPARAPQPPPILARLLSYPHFHQLNKQNRSHKLGSQSHSDEFVSGEENCWMLLQGKSVLWWIRDIRVLRPHSQQASLRIHLGNLIKNIGACFLFPTSTNSDKNLYLYSKSRS